MKNMFQVLTAGILALGLNSLASAYGSYSYGGLGEQYGNTSAFGVSCQCARLEAQGVDTTSVDPNCKPAIQRAINNRLGPASSGNINPFVQPGLHNGAVPQQQVPNPAFPNAI